MYVNGPIPEIIVKVALPLLRPLTVIGVVSSIRIKNSTSNSFVHLVKKLEFILSKPVAPAVVPK